MMLGEDSNNQIFLIIFLLTIAGLNAFSYLLHPPLSFGYILMMAVFLIVLLAEYTLRLKRTTHVVLILAIPITIQLIVIDPVEIGLYGWDPYWATLPTHQLLLSGAPITEVITSFGAWPAFYSLTVILERIGLPQMVIAKYIPLVTGTTPLFLYLAADTLMSRRGAFLSAIGLCSSRTLLLFEVKFIDETLAIFLFVLLIAVVTIVELPHTRKTLAIVVSITISLSHHMISLLVAIFLIMWFIIPKILSVSIVSRYFQSKPDPVELNTRALFILIGIILSSLFIYFNQGLTGSVLESTISAIFGGSYGEVAGIGAGETTIRSQIASAAIIVLFSMSLVCAYGVLSKTQIHEWTYSWIIYSGIVSIIYSGMLVAGRIIALDPIRLYTTLIITLIPATIYIFDVTGYLDNVAPTWKRVIPIILLVAFILTQVAAIQPHVMYSDPSQKTPFAESHYADSEFSASDWAGRYSSGTVWGFERGLWIRSELTYKERLDTGRVDCQKGELISFRKGTQPLLTENLIYRSHSTGLYSCRPKD